MKLKNAEAHAEFDCAPGRASDRTSGLSALVRIHDEESWIGLCLESVVDWCDEIIICLNLCTDRTPEIVEAFRSRYRAKVQVFDYPFKIHPMGPGHDDCSAGSVHSSAYFYNYTQAKSTRTHVLKWDGDMVAQDWIGAEIRRLMSEGKGRIKFRGTDLVGDDLTHIGSHPNCPTNGVYRVRDGVRYEQGTMTQSLRGVTEPPHVIEKPAFLHFKWARKSFESATVQWPENWRDIPHFQGIAARRHPVARYTGEYPTSIRDLLNEPSAA